VKEKGLIFTNLKGILPLVLSGKWLKGKEPASSF
jgi:hypothetical protein